MAEAIEVAERISQGAAAISFAKKAINRAFDMESEEAMTYLSKLYGEVYKTWDAKEGIAAYLEKRLPMFKGA